MSFFYSVIIPVYNSEHILEELHRRLLNVFDKHNSQFEIIFVDDFSKDNSADKIKEICKLDTRVIGVIQAKNFGQQKAVLAGMKYAKGDYIITMDDDLQHPPEEIPKLINAIIQSNSDVIIGEYIVKQHKPFRNIGTYLLNKITCKLFNKASNLKLTSFRIMKKYIAESLLSRNVYNPQIGHLILLTTNRIENVLVRHDKRSCGNSGYRITKLLSNFYNIILANSKIFLRFLIYTSVLVCIFLLLFFYITLNIKFYNILFCVLLIIIVFEVFIIGEYIFLILKTVETPPLYITREVINLKEDNFHEK